MAKRRKVWVNEWAADEDGQGGLGDLAWKTKAAALLGIASDGKAVRFIERLPGDVVLSREDVARAMALLDEVGGAYSDGQEKHAIRTLLRGRR